MKKIWLTLMSLYMVLIILSVTVNAEELQDGDYTYRILEDETAEIMGYSGDESEIIIPSEINGYEVTSIGEKAFYKNSNLKSVIISDGITSIGYYAFRDCDNLSDVTIPTSVTYIDGHAFARTAITEIELHEGIEHIGVAAFGACKNLTEIELPVGVTKIAADTFTGCTSLENVILPEGITSIEFGAFERCTSLKSIKLPDTLNDIHLYAFADCTNLASISIPKGVTAIGGHAFDGCSALTDVVLSEGLEDIHNSAFSRCGSLTKIIFPSGLKEISYNAFAECTSLLRVEIPDTVTIIDRNAFGECNSLTDVYYTAAEQEWEAINIVDKNECLINADLHFNSHMPLFEDVALTDWFYDAVSYVYEKDIMTGMNNTYFAPLNPLTRAQFTVILHRMQGKNYVVSLKKFDDVEDESWYTAAVLWAYENGIVSGYENTNRFGPHDNISREQLAVMMYRYAKSSGFDVETDADLSAFKDAGNVSGYAAEAMKWAVGNGIITGKANGTEIDPNGNALRAECATIIQRYIENLQDRDYEYQVLEDGTVEITDYVGADVEVVIPGILGGYQVTSIGEHAFSGCYNIQSIIIPEGVLKLREGSFSECRALTDIKIPDSVTSIEEFSFDACRSLKTIMIPKGVVSIGEMVFSSCRVLEAINVAEENMVFSSVDGVLLNKDKTKIILYPRNKSEDVYITPETVTTIGEDAFAYNDYVHEVIFSENVKNVEAYAFNGCANLSKVTLSDATNHISGSSFYWCDNLRIIEVPVNNKYLIFEDGILFNKDKTVLIKYLPYIDAETYTIPDSVVYIADGAFDECEKLRYVDIPDSVTKIGASAFHYCFSLVELNIPMNVTYIGASAFGYCENLVKINIPEGITSIEEDTFAGCISLKEILIPESVTSIGESAFAACHSLESIIIPYNVTDIPRDTFNSCFSLADVVLPDNLVNIGKHAFEWCVFEEITIPDGVTSIGEGAFSMNYRLSTVTIPESVRSIGAAAFSFCESLTDVFYKGDKALWDNIEIGVGNIYLIEDATIHYNYEPGKVSSIFQDIKEND